MMVAPSSKEKGENGRRLPVVSDEFSIVVFQTACKRFCFRITLFGGSLTFVIVAGWQIMLET
ncbi:hypothetical protein [Neisseria weixii]|uniref:hypothetical protein n=1 Tax=Neisseria weixii TaxID=1853276 RepID=UPI000F4E05FA|nr:hypothetical protein [Neisseria weixii]